MHTRLVQICSSTLSTPSRSKTSFLVGFVTGFFSLAAFLTTLFVSFVIASNAYGDDSSNGRLAEEPTQRPIGEMRRDVKAFMKNSKNEEDLDLQVGGIIDLCYMHREIVNDSRFQTHRQLQSLRAIAATRLKKYLKTIKIEKARKARREKKEQAELNKQLLAGEQPERPTPAQPVEDLPLVNNETNATPNSEISDEQALDDAMYASLSAIGATTGGPSQMFGYLSGNFAPPWDHGEELVALIESVISPDSWERNGGNAIIEYYRPSRIIVVGAASRVHDDLTDMLRNLRRLSR